MSDTHNFKKLSVHILERSIANNFNEAKSEWDLDKINKTMDFGRCPCGKRIKEHCYLKNKENGNKTWVGNVCVRKFMDIDTATLFDGLKRIQNNSSAKPNDKLIEYAWKQGYLYNEKEYRFLKDIRKTRKLSGKQLGWLQKANRRIVQNIVVRRVPDQIVISVGNDSESE